MASLLSLTYRNPEGRFPHTGTQERLVNVSPADTGCSMDSPAPDQHDPHSSEEELEVINRNKEEIAGRPARATSVCLPEKRKWSQISGGNFARNANLENVENMSPKSNTSPRSSCSPYQKEEAAHHSGSSDDEVHNLLASMSTPVQFRTSPPLEAVKPGRRTPLNKMRSSSPPAKLLHYDLSPRKRTRHSRHSQVQRPYLDFEKMQQVRKNPIHQLFFSGVIYRFLLTSI
ncbi:hypothetical protein WA026_006259 [Henosepilachna vigintioctopunctata]|uniref:Uncharacterized protein n=1 Tax=Henosepilachna vigintioctopunctata TaxID=420089 RepID=A0AAW1TJ37_9CUCU